MNSIPGYDAWKLASPPCDDEPERDEPVTYEVFVGNLGVTCRTRNVVAAIDDFLSFVRESVQKIGRAADEDVRMFVDDDILAEYNAPHIDDENNDIAARFSVTAGGPLWYDVYYKLKAIVNGEEC